MAKTKKTKEEILREKRLREQERRDKIKNDPIKYEIYKEKAKKRYHKRKIEKKVLPISELPPKKQKIMRERNRRNFKAYYERFKRQKNVLETIMERSEQETSEKEITAPMVDLKNADPLQSSPGPSRYNLRSSSTKQNNEAKLALDDRIFSPVDNVVSSSSKLQNISRESLSSSPNSSVFDAGLNNFRKRMMLHNELPRVSTPCHSEVKTRSNTPSALLQSPNNETYLEIQNTDNSFNDIAQEFSNPSSTHSTPSIRSLSSFTKTDTQRPSSNSSFSSPADSICKINPNIKTNEAKKAWTPTYGILRRHKYKSKIEIQNLKRKLEKLQKINEKYRKQIFRLKKCDDKDKKGKNTETVHNEIIENQSVPPKKMMKVQRDIETFLEQDENSQVCPGKKEFVSKKKLKKQKRYLTNTLRNLHIKYNDTHTYKISYSTFCKMRPFWILVPDVKARETCMCKVHANMDLIVTSLNRFGIISESSTHKVLSSICCDPGNTECLSRKCSICNSKIINYKEFDNSNNIFYWQWTTKKESYVKDGKKKLSTVTVKEKVITSPKNVIDLFEETLYPYMMHCRNKIAQNSYIQQLKANLPEQDCIVHVDYSENYNTKYASEIQSFHFGGSRKQITLHTSVIYYVKNGELQSQCFCTLSESLRHDAAAVWAHLIPILRFIQTEFPSINSIHFISDSPTGQYRNKKMFYIMTRLRWDYPNLKFVGWNYTESGHGKSAADGVGATIKRTADKIVAQGQDIANIKALMDHLQSNVQGIIIEEVLESDIFQKDLLFPIKLQEFKGTMKVHQTVWNADIPNLLEMRSLSCNSQDCIYKPVQCKHSKHLGFVTVESEIQNDSTQARTNDTNKKILISRPDLITSSRNVNNVDKSTKKIKIISCEVLQPALTKKHESPKCAGNDSLGLTETDSFWAPVSPPDLSLMPSNLFPDATKEVGVDENEQPNRIFDSDDDSIF